MYNGRALSQVLQADRFVLVTLISAASIFFTIRLPVGIDMTDESYYVTHIVEWLRNGFSGSNSLNIQQLSELIVYPFVRGQLEFVGGLSGILLFLRIFYAVMIISTAISLYSFIRRLRPAPLSALGAALLVVFIPFGLPAPSYNTIAMCGMTAALSLFGIAFAEASTDREAWFRPSVKVTAPLALSAILWGITVLAYPTLAPAPLVLVVVAVIMAKTKAEARIVAIYALMGVVVAGALALLLSSVFGMTRLYAMFDFTSASAQLAANGMGKLATTIARLKEQPLVSLAFATVTLVPLFVRPESDSGKLLRAIVYVIGLALVVASDAVAYIKSHDVIILALLFGIVVSFQESGPNEKLTLRLVVTTSGIGGLITAATAAMGIFNVPVGGFLAACLGLVLIIPRGGTASKLVSAICLAPLIATIGIVGFVSQMFIYGEVLAQRPTNPHVLESGPFKGLSTRPETRRFISEVTAAFSRHTESGKTVTVFGPVPGLYLMADLTPHGLSTWSLRSTTGNRARSMTEAFFNRRPPDFIALYRDPWTEPLGSTELLMLKQYFVVASVTVEWRTFELFARSEQSQGRSLDNTQ